MMYKLLMWGFVAIGVMVVLMYEPEPAYPQSSHSGPGHWYPKACCDLRDCRPLKQSEIHKTENGWRVSNQEVTYEKARPSGDNRWHGCFYQSGDLAGRVIVAIDPRHKKSWTPCIFIPKNAY